MTEWQPSTTRSGAHYGPQGTCSPFLDGSVAVSPIDLKNDNLEVIATLSDPLSVMDALDQKSSQPSGKCQLNGLATGLSLTDFIGKYESRIRHWELRHPNFTRRQAFGLLGEYLGGAP